MRGARWSGGLVISCLLGLYAGMSQGADIRDIRMWHAPDRSRLVLDLDDEPKYRVFSLDNPGRVVVDLENTRLMGRIPREGTVGQFVSRIRRGSPDGSTLRLVFDVQKPVRYFMQLLKPIDNYQYRLVIDFHDRDANPETRQGTLPDPLPKRKSPRDPGRKVLVLIDPGHGGEDPGALGKRAKEKDIVLAIAKRLERQLDKEPGIRARLTRTGDYYVGLRRRTLIAREQAADLFVSIHADAFKNKNVQGASVYALSRRGASSEMARWLANKENSSDLVGGVSLSDKDNLLAEVLLDLSMTKTVSESISFGREVLSELKKIGKIHSTRVEQAAFAVLKSPDIPSILVETAYITNPAEERLLRSHEHQTKIAGAVVAGIKRYLRKNPNVYAFHH